MVLTWVGFPLFVLFDQCGLMSEAVCSALLSVFIFARGNLFKSVRPIRTGLLQELLHGRFVISLNSRQQIILLIPPETVCDKCHHHQSQISLIACLRMFCNPLEYLLHNVTAPHILPLFADPIGDALLQNNELMVLLTILGGFREGALMEFEFLSAHVGVVGCQDHLLGLFEVVGRNVVLVAIFYHLAQADHYFAGLE